MRRFLALARASIGSKLLMAVTGLLMFGFLLGHLTGNLLIYQGRDAMNAYSQWLHDHPALLWTARLGLLAALAVHVGAGLRLARINRVARPVRYAHEDTVQATWASRHMVLTGLLVLTYVVYHLLHLTFQVIDTGGAGAVDAKGRADVYGMLVQGFQKPVVTLSYVVAQLVLGLHLVHGLGSMLQTVGWSGPARGRLLSVWLPALVVLGYVSIPVTVLLGFVE